MNKEEGKHGLSLRAKHTLIFIGLFVLLIVMLWLLNHFGLEKYYVSQRLEQLNSTRILLEELARDPEDELIQARLGESIERSGIGAILIIRGQGDGTERILYSGGEEERGLWRFMELERSLMSLPEQIYEEAASYVIYRTRDPMSTLEKISCLGSVEGADGNCTYFLSMSLAMIADSARISNRFLLLVGLGVLLAGSLIMLYATKRMTDPIVTLSDLSRQMASLDFSQRFQGSSGDEIQQLGESINQLSDNLEETIGSLRRANEKLEQDIRLKEELDQQRRALLSNISHELKTPIALIQGYAEGLREGMAEDEALRIRYSDIIIEEAERMNRLVRQLLSLDELESGSLEIQPEPIDLAALLREICGSFERIQSEKQVRLEMDFPEQLMVESDELLLEQMVQNYISNAFQYVREGGLIRIQAQARGEKGAVFSVYNEGDLIPEEDLDQIWNKFYKVDKARTRSYGGSGIGLSVVKAAAEHLGGGCRGENKENGVEFTAWI